MRFFGLIIYLGVVLGVLIDDLSASSTFVGCRIRCRENLVQTAMPTLYIRQTQAQGGIVNSLMPQPMVLNTRNNIVAQCLMGCDNFMDITGFLMYVIAYAQESYMRNLAQLLHQKYLNDQNSPQSNYQMFRKWFHEQGVSKIEQAVLENPSVREQAIKNLAYVHGAFSSDSAPPDFLINPNTGAPPLSNNGSTPIGNGMTVPGATPPTPGNGAVMPGVPGAGGGSQMPAATPGVGGMQGVPAGTPAAAPTAPSSGGAGLGGIMSMIPGLVGGGGTGQ